MTFFQSSNAAYNVVSYGARPDGQTDSTQAFQKAWTATCSSRLPATFYVPAGRFLIRSVVFGGPCMNRIVVQIDGTLVAPSNYWNLGNSGFWILFIQSITFVASDNILISGLTSINSQTMHVALNGCNNVKIRNMKIIASGQSPNTDGIHLQSSTGVTITNCIIKTGDDCISIGPGNKNLWIERIACGPGHGISIGSLGNSLIEAGVNNVTVRNSIFTGTQNGVRIKTWGRPSNGFATNIAFRNIIMRQVGNPIVIDQKYCPYNQCPTQSSGVKISQVRYKNIKGTSATPVAMTFNCSPSNPCTGIRLQDIRLTYMNSPATSFCSNAHGSNSGLIVSRVVSLLFIALFHSTNAAYNVISYGAKPDGKTDSTQSFLKAWALACSSVKPATINVPQGRFLIKPVVFRGPCKNSITLQLQGTIVAPSDYRALGNSGYWILFISVDRVSVYGGTLDAKAADFWACRTAGKNCPVGARVCYT
ncbi:hypothetical protein L1049_016681 [Liquidambar formosana]|uniref:Polygalacturonase n=1 Tax=Liquidambar formosana TaxID=63359 RepID=A0AAP0X3M1_LIQFO